MENQNGTFRHKRINFAQISNTALQDKSLSLKAKGLYALIQSLITIPGIDLRLWKLRSLCKEGDKAWDSAWKELKDAGYLKQYRIPSGKRGAFSYEYDLLDEPDLSTPAFINLTRDHEESQSNAASGSADSSDIPNESGEQIPFESAVEEEDDSSKTATVSYSDHTPQKGGYGKNAGENGLDHTPPLASYAKRMACLKHPMLKGGDNSNTKSGNTPSSNTLLGNTQSVSQPADPENPTDGQTDEIRSELKKQINFDWIADTHPDDQAAAAALLNCMVEMLTVPSTRINGTEQSRYALRKLFKHVDEEDITEFIEHMRSRNIKPKEIRNVGAYWKSALFNYLREQSLLQSTL